MEELKKAKLWRFILRILFFVVAIILPAVLMITHFELTKEVTTTKTKVTFYGFIVFFILFVLIWKFKGKLGAWIEKWEYSYMKYFFIGLSKIWIYILVAIVIIYTKATINSAVELATNGIKTAVSTAFNTIEYCIIVIASCETVAYLVIAPIEEKFDYQVKRYIRKQERKEDYKEAIREMHEEGKN